MNNRQMKDLAFQKHVLWSLEHELHGVTKEIPITEMRLQHMRDRVAAIPAEIVAQKGKIERLIASYKTAGKEEAKKNRVKSLKQQIKEKEAELYRMEAEAQAKATS